MTILEKIKFEEDWLSEVNLTMENIKIAFAGIRATALEPQRWILVSERLPEENISVIGTTKYNDIYETKLYNDCGKHKWYADGNYDVPIVAWIPLPEPYSESEDEE